MSKKVKNCIKSNTVGQEIFKQGLTIWVGFLLPNTGEHKEAAGTDKV